MALLLRDGSVTSKSEPSDAGTTAYVYRWTHIPTGKWYVGSRTAKGSHPNDGYYVAPDGQIFDSSRKAAAKYNVTRHTIVNWSKNNKNGWTFQPKGVI